ncbi:hypothetical protein VTL71DRAFT_15733 [Oculimacula yallundae]|uniref:Uncharacterized protein n=1 Tax=Oculimacula yallundae TaxID=86028 RepID=A0ABR4CDQ2_9HELO
MDKFIAGTVDFLTWLSSLPKQGYINLTRNAVHMWDDMSMLNYIRMIAIVGGYLFLRPYLQRYGERVQARNHEKMLAKKATEEKGGKAKISPNALRAGGGKSVKFADEGGDAVEEKEEWGKKAKKRQKKVQDLLDKEGKRLEDLDDEEDKDIMQYLVDYEEGKDGW